MMPMTINLNSQDLFSYEIDEQPILYDPITKKSAIKPKRFINSSRPKEQEKKMKKRED